MSVTGKQIAMARILLDMSQEELADRLAIARKTVMRIENGQSPGSASTLEKIKAYLESRHIVFSGEHGVDRRTGEVITLHGADGLKELVNDIYDATQQQQQSGQNTRNFVCLYNARPENWIKWLSQEWWDMHTKRMTAIGGNLQRIMISEGEKHLISQLFSEHRYFPAHLFNDQSVYAYGDKLAFVTFGDDFVTINILQNAQFSRGFRALFDIAWERVAKPVQDREKKGKAA